MKCPCFGHLLVSSFPGAASRLSPPVLEEYREVADYFLSFYFWGWCAVTMVEFARLTSHPLPLRSANKLGETCNRDSPSSRFYFVTANSLVRLALSAPAYYQVDLVFSASLAGEFAPVCVVLPLLVVFPWLWVYLENPIPCNSKSRLVLRPILPRPPPLTGSWEERDYTIYIHTQMTVNLFTYS